MTGADRFAADQRKVINLDDQYIPYPRQADFHRSSAPYRFLGGAAGPGKTTALLMENLIRVNEFNADDGKQVQTLMLRRTQPQVRNTLVTRFREKIPRELYRKFNETTLTCTWLNNAITQFGSMQYEQDWQQWQGQWLDINYDELCEFVWPQWSNMAPWNRCPVSPKARRMGAGNPIGVGTAWVRPVFVDHKPFDGMDARQRLQYRPTDYAYFPCTYLDNPIFANDPQFIAGLMALPEPLRKALMEGSWDITGGYFTGAYDEAENVFPTHEWAPQPWHRQWISGDWGYEHFTALYRHYMDDFGILRTGRELMLQRMDPDQIGHAIIPWLMDEQGKFPKLVSFPFSHDAFADGTTKSYGKNPKPVAMQIAEVIRPYGITAPSNSGKDKLGREQAMYQYLRRPEWGGKYNIDKQKIMLRKWMIADDCPKLKETLVAAPRDPDRIEMIASFSGDDPLQGAGYGVYHILGKPSSIPHEEMLRRELAATPDPVQNYLIQLREHQRQEKQGAERNWWE